MLTYENASSDGDVTVFCTQREGAVIVTAIYPDVCIFGFSVSTVYVNGHVGLSGGVVTLTQSLSVTADLGTRWHSGRGEKLSF